MQGNSPFQDQRCICNLDSVENLSSSEPSTPTKKPPTKQKFHFHMAAKMVCAALLVAATLCSISSGWFQVRRKTSLRSPNGSVKPRVLQEHTNVFLRSSATFLVQWGTLQSGCRAPPKAQLLLECSGGELNVLQGSEDCVETLWGGAACSLPIDGVESKGLLWKQGMIVATCEPMGNFVENEASVEFIASFAFDYPTVCLGKPVDHLPEDLSEWPQGNFETFLESSQLCTSDGEYMHLLEPSESFGCNSRAVKLFDQTETSVYRAADTCTVPDCSLLGPGFICPPVVLPCQVNPPPLIVSHNGTGSCKDVGFRDIASDHQFWSSLKSYQLSSANLIEAGFGTGAGYHL